MTTDVRPSDHIAGSRLPPVSGVRRLWSATLMFCEAFAEAIAEARVMQRAAHRRHSFTDH